MILFAFWMLLPSKIGSALEKTEKYILRELMLFFIRSKFFTRKVYPHWNWLLFPLKNRLPLSRHANFHLYTISKNDFTRQIPFSLIASDWKRKKEEKELKEKQEEKYKMVYYVGRARVCCVFSSFAVFISVYHITVLFLPPS